MQKVNHSFLGLKCFLFNMSRIKLLKNVTHSQLSLTVLLSTSTDVYVDNLVIEAGSRREKCLTKYFTCTSESIDDKTVFLLNKRPRDQILNTELNQYSKYDRKCVLDMFKCIESDIRFRANVPNEELKLQLTYFSKNGNINGVKAIQMVIKKHNMSNFNNHSDYNHFLAEALWINGKIESSLNLFLSTYSNPKVQGKIKLMLNCLFPLLIDQHSEGKLQKAISLLEKFSTDKQDPFLLALLWKELFKSSWFSDQQLAVKILHSNIILIQVIQWMVPALGKDLLKTHKLDDYYRLIELCLSNDLKDFAVLLLQLLFDYYYIHQNIRRCSEVVKYCSTLGSSLTEEQHRRYLQLLLRSKDSVVSKTNIKPPQNICFKF